MADATWSLHTHSAYCDGEGSLGDVVEAAVKLGLTDLGFSSHAPLPFPTGWTMKLEDSMRYVEEVQDLRVRYAGRINLWLGAELDCIPTEEVRRFQEAEIFPLPFEYFVGSVHFLGAGSDQREFDGSDEQFAELLRTDYGGDVRLMTRDYYERIAELAHLPRVRIVAHLDLIKRWNAAKTYFQGTEPWYRGQVEDCLQAVAGSGLMVELNTAGWRKNLGEPYPAPWILERCRDLGIPVTVSADSHRPDDLTWGYDQAASLLASLDIVPAKPLGTEFALPSDRAGV